MRLDFTNVEGQKSFEPIPAGKYIVEVTDFREGTASEAAKNAGAPTISWEFTVVSTLSGDETVTDGKTKSEIKVTDRKIWDNMTLVENSLFRLKALLEACGFEADEEIDFDPDDVLSSQFVAQVGIQPARKNPTTGDEYAARNNVKAFHMMQDSNA